MGSPSIFIGGGLDGAMALLKESRASRKNADHDSDEADSDKSPTEESKAEED